MFSPPLTRSRARKLRELATQPEEPVGPLYATAGKKKPLSPGAAAAVEAKPAKRAKELELTQEEASLKGAPEGAVYDVSVRNSEQIEQSKAPETEIQNAMQVIEADPSADNWAEQHMAVDTIRRMAIHHPAVLTPHMAWAVKIVLGTMSNLRSSMVRNALLAVKDLFEHVDEAMKPFTEEVVEGVLRKTSGDKKFICEAAISTLGTIVRKGPFLQTLQGLATGVQSKNADIAAQSLKGVDGLATRFLKKGTLREEVLDSTEDGTSTRMQILLDASIAGLNSRNPLGKNSARATLRKLRQALTAEVFEQTVRETLPQNTAEEAVRESIRPPMGASKSVGAINRGGSIRDKILAAKKQQASMHEVGSHRSHHSSDAIAVEFKTKDQSTALRVDV